MGVVYWNLILQLFRTNAQFKTVCQQTILCHKTNIIFHLVYNSLSCYLFTSPKHCNTVDIVGTSTSVDGEPASSAATSILLNEYCWIPTTSAYNKTVHICGAINRLANIDCDSLSIINNLTQPANTDEELSLLLSNKSDSNCDGALTINDPLSSIDVVYKRNGIFRICHDVDFHEIVSNSEKVQQQHQENPIEFSSFASEYLCNSSNSYRNTSSSNNSFDSNASYIFNLRNVKSETSLDVLNNTDLTHYCNSTGQTNGTTIDILSMGVKKLQNLISNSVYKIFYSNSCDDSDGESKYNQNENDQCPGNDNQGIDSDPKIGNESDLFAHEQIIAFGTSVEQKKLFLQIFEITCGIMMSDQNREVRGKIFVLFFNNFHHIL